MKFHRGIYKNKGKEQTSTSRKLTETALINPYSDSAHLKSELKNTVELLKKAQGNDFDENALDANMTRLKQLLASTPINTDIDNSAEIITNIVEEPEAHQTVREERWADGVYCPECHSTNIEKLGATSQETAHAHKYRCTDCGAEFDDTTGLPFDGRLPTVKEWMQCWYLLGITTSIDIIAEKLGLDPLLVREMVEALQKAFKAQQPQTANIKESNWSQYQKTLQDKIAQVMEEKKNELYGGAIVRQARDTAEERKQKKRHTPKNRKL